MRMNKKRGNKKRENKKGLSTVIASLLMILLSIVAIGIIWVVVQNLVQDKLKGVSCVDTVGKVSIGDFTCFVNHPDFKGLYVQVDVGNIKPEGFLIKLNGDGESKSVEIKNGLMGNGYLRMKDDTPPYGEIVIPNANEGRTYSIILDYTTVTDKSTEPYYLSGLKGIQLSPIMNSESCPATDTLTDIPACAT